MNPGKPLSPSKPEIQNCAIFTRCKLYSGSFCSDERLEIKDVEKDGFNNLSFQQIAFYPQNRFVRKDHFSFLYRPNVSFERSEERRVGKEWSDCNKLSY